MNRIVILGILMMMFNTAYANDAEGISPPPCVDYGWEWLDESQ